MFSLSRYLHELSMELLHEHNMTCVTRVMSVAAWLLCMCYACAMLWEYRLSAAGLRYFRLRLMTSNPGIQTISSWP